MKEISELNLPDDLRYAKDHEWARVEGDKVRVIESRPYSKEKCWKLEEVIERAK